MSINENNKETTKEFLNLVLKNQKIVFNYILTIVPNYQNAEDIYQDTVTLLWEKFDQYKPGTNFGAWACVVAKHKALQFTRKNSNNRICFSPDIIELLDSTLTVIKDEQEDRIDMLKQCLKKLPVENLHLLKMKYEKGWPVKKIAALANRTVQSIYLHLNRIQQSLLACIERNLNP